MISLILWNLHKVVSQAAGLAATMIYLILYSIDYYLSLDLDLKSY